MAKETDSFNWYLNFNWILFSYRPLTSRLPFVKSIYFVLSEAVINHFNRVFGLSLLLYLFSKLISTSIGCHGFIVDLINNGSISVYWFFTNVPDFLGILVTFQSADYVQGKVISFYCPCFLFFFLNEIFYSIQVKNFLSSANKISTQELTIVERSEVYLYFCREMVQLEMIEFYIMP